MKIEVPVSLGELVDKMTILKIKQERIGNKEKKALATSEYEELERVLSSLCLSGLDDLASELKSINEKLWVIEDDIRSKEAQSTFDEEFITLARNVYITNDERFRVKNQINEMYGSSIKEVKSYEQY